MEPITDETRFSITPAELFTLLTVVDECDNYGVPWFEPLLATISTNDFSKVMGAVKFLVQEINKEADKIDLLPKRRSPLRAKKKRPKKDDNENENQHQ